MPSAQGILSAARDSGDTPIAALCIGAKMAVLLRDLEVESCGWNAQYEATSAPVGIVEKGIEVLCDEFVRVPFEIAPFVRVDEPGRGDRSSGRYRAEPLTFIQAKRTIDRHEFVVMKLAHQM